MQVNGIEVLVQNHGTANNPKWFITANGKLAEKPCKSRREAVKLAVAFVKKLQAQIDDASN